VAAPGLEMGNLSAAMENPEAASPSSVIALQQRYGNRAVRRLLQREGEAPTTTAPTSRFDLETPRGMWKHLSLLYHPDKARNPEEIPWRRELMFKINDARNDLAALKRLAAEGEAHATGPAPTTAPTTEPSSDLATLPSDGGPQAPLSQELVQNSAPLAIELSSSSQESPSEEPPGTTPEPSTGPTAEQEENRPDRPVYQEAHLRMQTLGHNRKVLPVLKKYMAGQNASNNYNFYFDASQNMKDLYRKYIADGAPQQVQLPAQLKQQMDDASQDTGRLASLMERARAANQEFINTTILPVFELAAEYQTFKTTSRDRPVLARMAQTVRGAVRSRAADQVASTRRTVAVLDQAIDRYTRVFLNGRIQVREFDDNFRESRRIYQSGLDLSSHEAEKAKMAQRLLQQGQIRHANIVAAFTRLYAADKTFRKDRYGAFYARLSAFTKLWVEYKTFLQR
jgi:hypothetical protein